MSEWDQFPVADPFEQFPKVQEAGSGVSPQALAFESIPDPIRHGLEAAAETAGAFVPKTAGEALVMGTPIGTAIEQGKQWYGFARDLVSGKPVLEAAVDNIPLARQGMEMEATPAWSKERYGFGFSILAQLGMAAGFAKGVIPKEAKAPVTDSVVRSSSSGPVDLATMESPITQEMRGGSQIDLSSAGTATGDVFSGIRAPQPEPVTSSNVVLDTVRRNEPLAAEARQLQAEVEVMRAAGQRPPNVLTDRIAELNRQIAEPLPLPEERVVPERVAPADQTAFPAEGARAEDLTTPQPAAEGGAQVTTALSGGEAVASNPVAQTLRPAIRAEGNRVIAGDRGQIHNDIYAAQPDPTALRATDPEHGFVNGKGQFLSREEAATLLGESEPLQSERLIELQNGKPTTAGGTGEGTTTGRSEAVGAENGAPPSSAKPVDESGPANTGVERKQSKIGKSIEAKAVEAKLADGFAHVAEYDPITIRDQAQQATRLVNESMDAARAIVRGEQPLPGNLRGTALITAIEEHLVRKPDTQLSYELANSKLTSGTSAAAQEMRLMSERVPDSLSAKFNEIREARRNASKSRGQTVEKVKAEMQTEIQRTASKPSAWEAFVRQIAC